MSLLDKQIVFKLNKLWQPYELCTVREAVVFLCPEADKDPQGYAMDYETDTLGDGNRILSSPPRPVDWDEWITLPVRPGDDYISVSRDRRIRLPRVIICASYKSIPLKTVRETIWSRDKGKCQYTGDEVTRETGNIDHIQPRSRGGKDVPENKVVSRRDLNSRKGNRLNEEIGYKLMNEPRPLRTYHIKRLYHKADARHPDQLPFLLD